MSKIRIIYVCTECGTTSVKWKGKCNSCGSWNSYVEETVSASSTSKKTNLSGSVQVFRLDDIETEIPDRIQTLDAEMDRVLGGGIVPGSAILLGGEPGIGKSTLLLQLALKLKQFPVLYISGEESLNQIIMRALRTGLENDNCYFLPETEINKVIAAYEQLKPGLIIADSIQTMVNSSIDSTAGSIIQIKTCTAMLSELAKKTGIPVIIIGHITKDGYIAGPKVMEHIVDTVLYFEGDRHYHYRILRTMKNRFGSVSEIGIYEMTEKGLEPVLNPSEILLSHRQTPLSGTGIAAIIEGIRPMLVEFQALATPTAYGTPQRNTTGFDNKRLAMLLAVLEKRYGLKLNMQDVFLNVAGGLKINDPSTDLAVMAAIASSLNDMPVPEGYCFAGEVGLSGEIRPVYHLELRVAEAAKLGFKKIFTSSYKQEKNRKKLEQFPIDIHFSGTAGEVIYGLFEK